MPLIMIAGKSKDFDCYCINTIFCQLSTAGMETLNEFPLPITLFDTQTKQNVTTSIVEVQTEVKCLCSRAQWQCSAKVHMLKLKQQPALHLYFRFVCSCFDLQKHLVLHIQKKITSHYLGKQTSLKQENATWCYSSLWVAAEPLPSSMNKISISG